MVGTGSESLHCLPGTPGVSGTITWKIETYLRIVKNEALLWETYYAWRPQST